MMRCKVTTCDHQDTAHRVVARSSDGLAYMSLRCVWCDEDCQKFDAGSVTTVTLSALQMCFKLLPLPARPLRLEVESKMCPFAAERESCRNIAYSEAHMEYVHGWPPRVPVDLRQ